MSAFLLGSKRLDFCAYNPGDPLWQKKNEQHQHQPNGRAVLRSFRMLARVDRTGWLGLEDSNLQMSFHDVYCSWWAKGLRSHNVR